MKTDQVQDLFQNNYRISSARLQSWNYGSQGMYFVTICTENKEHYFGHIVESVVETRCIASLQPTEIGKIAQLEWIKTMELRPDMNIEMGEFIVMPNHVHGIIIIGNNQFNGVNRDDINDVGIDGAGRDAMHRVSTNANNTNTNGPQNQFGPQSKNLASILRGYKSAVTTYARKNNIPFAWQPRFHDHIIRSDDAFNRISNYIVNNPASWHKDKFYIKQ